MRVALLIAGYLRTFRVNIPNLKSRIIDYFDSVDIYIHVTKNEVSQDKYFNPNNDVDDLRHIQNVLNPKVIIYEDNHLFSTDLKRNNLFNNWIKYFKLNEIRKINEVGFKYDLIIKYRPDLNIISEKIFPTKIEKNTIYLPSDTKIDRAKLHNPEDNYICDIFAFGDTSVMNDYFNIYKSLDTLTKDSGSTPETILHNYLYKLNSKIKFLEIEYNLILSLCNVFAIAGDSGSGKTTLGNILKNYFSNSFMLECDRYHKWERGDDNWKKFTHLNPDANYITKMSEDIFDLKIGKTIHHVNYDHASGKFTKEQQVESSDNLIVCGLHSLLGENDGIYNLKIFVDTDKSLKLLWKIKRDMSERGYTHKQVISQIKSRKNDFQKYILPQRESSDIIINFTTDDYVDLDDLEQNLNIFLNVFIHKKYQLLEILSYFSEKNIIYEISTNEKIHNKLTFRIFKTLDDRRFNLNNFYDYIVLIIHLIEKKSI